MTHLVAFPYATIDGTFDAPDAPRWMILDRTDLELFAADRVASALESTAGPSAAGVAHIDAIVEALTARPGPQRDLVGELHERADQVDRLTAEQGSMLRTLSDNSRLLIRGGAGTGKSFLAVEQARRLARHGQRVGFVCYSSGLASFVQRRFKTFAATEQPAYIGTFHNLGVQWGALPVEGADQDYWNEQLPVEMVKLAAGPAAQTSVRRVRRRRGAGLRRLLVASAARRAADAESGGLYGLRRRGPAHLRPARDAPRSSDPVNARRQPAQQPADRDRRSSPGC